MRRVDVEEEGIERRLLLEGGRIEGSIEGEEEEVEDEGVLRGEATIDSRNGLLVVD